MAAEKPINHPSLVGTTGALYNRCISEESEALDSGRSLPINSHGISLGVNVNYFNCAQW